MTVSEIVHPVMIKQTENDPMSGLAIVNIKNGQEKQFQ